MWSRYDEWKTTDPRDAEWEREAELRDATARRLGITDCEVTREQMDEHAEYLDSQEPDWDGLRDERMERRMDERMERLDRDVVDYGD